MPDDVRPAIECPNCGGPVDISKMKRDKKGKPINCKCPKCSYELEQYDIPE